MAAAPDGVKGWIGPPDMDGKGRQGAGRCG